MSARSFTLPFSRPVALAILSCSVACGGSAPPASEPVAVSSSVGTLDIPEASRRPAAEIALLEPGSGERTALRFRSQVGDAVSVQMQMQMQIAVRVAGQGGPTATPPIRASYDQTTTAVDESGRMRIEFAMRGVTVEQDGSPLATRLAQDMEPLARASGWAIMDERGRTLAAEFEMPDAEQSAQQSMANIRDTMTQLTPPFPEEPVGVGARWTATSHITGKMNIDQVATYTLVSLADDGVILDVALTQTAAPQRVETGQEGVVAELRSMSGSGEGRMTIRTDRLVPQAESTLQTEMSMVVTGPDGTAQDFEMALELQTEVRPQ